jgi:hypothetical protein
VKIIEPGSAPGTSFTARAQAEVGGLPIPDDYSAFLAQTAQVYGAMATNADSDAVGKVVEAMFAAATSGTHQLRYMPNDDIRPILTARRASSEQYFTALMRDFFLSHPTSTNP